MTTPELTIVPTPVKAPLDAAVLINPGCADVAATLVAAPAAASAPVDLAA